MWNEKRDSRKLFLSPSLTLQRNLSEEYPRPRVKTPHSSFSSCSSWWRPSLLFWPSLWARSWPTSTPRPRTSSWRVCIISRRNPLSCKRQRISHFSIRWTDLTGLFRAFIGAYFVVTCSRTYRICFNWRPCIHCRWFSFSNVFLFFFGSQEVLWSRLSLKLTAVILSSILGILTLLKGRTRIFLPAFYVNIYLKCRDALSNEIAQLLSEVRNLTASLNPVCHNNLSFLIRPLSSINIVQLRTDIVQCSWNH